MRPDDPGGPVPGESMTARPAGPGAGTGYRNILVAVDGSRNSDLALNTALSLAGREDARITLVAVEPDATGSAAQWATVSAPSTELQAELRDRFRDVLRAAADMLPDGVSVTMSHRFGKAGPEIIAQAGEDSYDLIVLGARGVGRVGSILGSVSQHVLHHAKTTVMVVHTPDRDRGPVPADAGPAGPRA